MQATAVMSATERTLAAAEISATAWTQAIPVARTPALAGKPGTEDSVANHLMAIAKKPATSGTPQKKVRKQSRRQLKGTLTAGSVTGSEGHLC